MSKPKKLVIPESDDNFLSGVLAGIKKRSKSLKYHSWEMSVERIFEEYEGERCEKLEVKIKPSDHNAWIELNVWQDRWITVNCWERTKEGKWDWCYEGKVLPEFEGKPLIQALEATNSRFWGMDEEKTDLFSSIWSPMLAKGPHLVRRD